MKRGDGVKDRRRCLSAFAAVGAVALFSSCSPSESTQTVSFVLALDAQRLTRIEFVVSPATGNFVGDDGG